MAHTVTMSLSDEAYQVWRAFPKGTRSPSIAALLVDANKLRSQELLIKALRQQITNNKRIMATLELRIMNEASNNSYPSNAEIVALKERLGGGV